MRTKCSTITRLVVMTGSAASLAVAAPIAEAETAYFAAGGVRGAENRSARASASKPYLVARSCGQSAVVRDACRAAIRYLRALDLDQPEKACAELTQATLANAGGMRGCVATLETARGIRIRYGIHEVAKTILGTSIRFRTRAIDGTGPGIDQVMILQPEKGRQRVKIVMADP